MSFLNKLFGNKKQETPKHKSFKEGDLLYTESEGKYHICKLLKIDNDFDAFHVLAFEDTTSLPKPSEIANIKIQIHHFPIAQSGLKDSKFLFNKAVSDDDLQGYFLYLQQTGDMAELVKYASKFYEEAYDLTDKNKQDEAIRKYSLAIELMPNFYEAIDNRAFCFMNLGKWQEAIQGFHQSLQVNPDSILAIFSIGECHLRLKEYSKAKEYFGKANQIDPTNPKPIEFLEITNKLLSE